MDMAFDEGQMKIGRRLAIKLLNASKFALGFVPEGAARPRRASPSRSTGRCSPGSPTSSTRRREAFDRFDYARALERTETWFWAFCDDYLELVKGRAYGDGPGARRRRPATLGLALETILQAVRPVPALRHRGGLVVVAGGLDPPVGVARRADARDGDAGTDRACSRRRRRCREIRKAKSEAKRSMRTEIERAVVRDTTERIAALRARRGRPRARPAASPTSSLDDGDGFSVERRARPTRGRPSFFGGLRRPAHRRPPKDQILNDGLDVQRVAPPGSWWPRRRRPRG